KLSDEEFIKAGNFTVSDTEKLLKTVPLMKDRAQTFAEARAMLDGELSCLFTTPSLDLPTLAAKEPEGSPGFTKEALEGLRKPLEALQEGVSSEAAKEALMPHADRNPKEKGGRGALLWPLRYALSGAEKSPDPFTLVS